MNTIRTTLFVGPLLVVLCAAACGNDSATTPVTSPKDGTKQLEPKDGFKELLSYDWKIEPGVEAYYCIYKTLTEDLWVSSFRPVSPHGTHHVTLGYMEPVGPDGPVALTDEDLKYPCNGFTLGDNLAAVAGVGTGDFVMPDGVAMKIPKGKQLLLSVHVLNAGDKPLSGHSGYAIVSPKSEDVVNEAEVVAADNMAIEIPPGKSTQTSTCTMAADATIFGVMAHMHYMGVHFKASSTDRDGKSVSIVDKDYDFERQTFDRIEPSIQLQKGTKIDVACDYQNTSEDILRFGESTDKTEMCIAFVYRYPAVATGTFGFNCPN